MKRLVILLVLLLVAGLAACSTSGSKSGASSSSPAPSKTTSSPSPSSSSPPQAGTRGKQPPIQSGDWRMDSITVRDDGLGDFTGRARITYTGSSPSGGTNTFTVTVFKGGKDIATLDGSANDVLPGHTTTAELVSTDHFVAGPYTYDFQKGF
ncbi:hypothetical protein [Streptomyces sp. NPDC001604]|uniref:hypothetical protein n=1 Tax=Streptomyces sp. NPDC001604 TaxID=3364593 RepID=UPI0036CAB4A0